MRTGRNYAINDVGADVPPALGAVVTVSATWRYWRLLVAAWRRLTRWEYWPIWAIYPPVVLQALWCGLRHWSVTLFTAVNPGMPAGGGVVGDSKIAILRGLAGAGDAVAAWAPVESGPFPQRNAAVRRFMAEQGLGYPVVLKPDRGERGVGVVIARDALMVERVLREQAETLVVQAHVPGVEWGVFYVRRPGAIRGEIFSITEKRSVGVVGDGRRTLERLILADDRAVGMSRFFLREHAEQLQTVPAAGQWVALSELGTHCRGALFLDGGHLVTPKFVDAVERVSRSFDGFHFGRYDLRAASLEAMQAGDFKVIELNGVTSEAAHIYDPQYSVWHGWRTLCRQWRLAYAIGAANRRAGAKVWTLSELRQLLREHQST